MSAFKNRSLYYITEPSCLTWTHLGSFDDLSEVVQYGSDVIFQSLVVVLQKSLFTLREHSLGGHSKVALSTFLTWKKRKQHI